MDPNQSQNQNINQEPTAQTPPMTTAPDGAVPPTQPPTPPPIPSGPAVPAPSGGDMKQDHDLNKKVILFVIVGILILVALVVTYFLVQQLNSSGQGSNVQESLTPIPTQVLTPTSTPTPTPLSENDIDTIDLGDPEADLKNIDDDVKQL